MGYRLWDLESRKVVRSNDLYFNEAKYHSKLKRVEEIKRVIFEEDGPIRARQNVWAQEEQGQDRLEPQESVQMKDSAKWQLAMQSEMTALEKNETWKLIKLPQAKKALPCKWVYRYKITVHDCQPKYKARLIAKGFKQEKGIDFDEVFSPVVKMMTLRCFLALVAKMDLELHQMDVKTAFLHGDLNEETYIQQPEGFG
ncbi:hypothetical protein L7F22_054250 [Adiantum nelumboides]|nr:hypothetical protein [Adiantum nelumboides]